MGPSRNEAARGGQMRLRQFLSLLISVALIAGLPAIASASAAGQDCGTGGSADAEGGCCGGTNTPVCSMACPVPCAAAAEKASYHFQPATGESPAARTATRAGLFAGPPDPAPPKTPSV